MGLTTCATCGRLITDAIEFCPNCLDEQLRHLSVGDKFTFHRRKELDASNLDLVGEQVGALFGSVGIGIIDNVFFGSLKRQSLLFDRIGICSLSHLLVVLQTERARPPGSYLLPLWEQFSRQANMRDELNELVWLVENEILFEPNGQLAVSEGLEFPEHENRWPSVGVKVSIRNIAEWIVARNVSARLRKQGKDAVLIAEKKGWEFDRITPSLDRVLTVVIRQFPHIDDSIPWEDVIQFREDPEHRSKLIALRRWMRDMAVKDGSAVELSEQLEHLLHEYAAYMKLQRMKASVGRLKCTLTAPLEILENLVKFKWKEIANPLFTLVESHFQLVEAEQKAPGRELSYILGVQKRFRR